MEEYEKTGIRFWVTRPSPQNLLCRKPSPRSRSESRNIRQSLTLSVLQTVPRFGPYDLWWRWKSGNRVEDRKFSPGKLLWWAWLVMEVGANEPWVCCWCNFILLWVLCPIDKFAAGWCMERKDAKRLGLNSKRQDLLHRIAYAKKRTRLTKKCVRGTQRSAAWKWHEWFAESGHSSRVAREVDNLILQKVALFNTEISVKCCRNMNLPDRKRGSPLENAIVHNILCFKRHESSAGIHDAHSHFSDCKFYGRLNSILNFGVRFQHFFSSFL